eukprot:m.180871 g.180871  ORF g.180871 m.180871 type:complete len:70 (-) comp13579_c0_seq16:1094-1303(-)
MGYYKTHATASVMIFSDNTRCEMLYGTHSSVINKPTNQQIITHVHTLPHTHASLTKQRFTCSIKHPAGI